MQWFVDDQLLAEVGPPYAAPWSLSPGEHTIELRSPGLPAAAVQITVR